MYSVVLRPLDFVPHTFSPCFSTSSLSFLTCFHLLIEADNANKNAVKIPQISGCFFPCYAASVSKEKQTSFRSLLRLLYLQKNFVPITPRLFSLFRLFYDNSAKP
jgi:hypothetical protein